MFFKKVILLSTVTAIVALGIIATPAATFNTELIALLCGSPPAATAELNPGSTHTGKDINSIGNPATSRSATIAAVTSTASRASLTGVNFTIRPPIAATLSNRVMIASVPTFLNSDYAAASPPTTATTNAVANTTTIIDAGESQFGRLA